MDDTTRAPELLQPVRVSWRAVTFVAVTLAYVLLTVGLFYRSPVLDLDHQIRQLHLYSRWPAVYTVLHPYVILGQRGPSLAVAVPWFAWIAWRFRSPRPFLMLGTALVVLNVSVGVVKLITGRLGPLDTARVGAVLRGGNIYPSGHTSNAVVLYGLVAMIAVHYGLRYTRTVIVAAAFISVTVGLSTVYLATHWLSDVVGGWLAGALVLLALPTLMPYVERAYDHALRRLRRRRILSAHVADVLLPAEPAGREKERVPA